MKIYHGSTIAVPQPRIINFDRTLDFGQGFYTTSNEEQAINWATRVAERRKTDVKIINEYEYDNIAAEKTLRIIRFDATSGEWLDFVCQNRKGEIPKLSYDIVYGPVANDDVYGTIMLYEQGFLDRETAIKRFKVRELYNQILFHSQDSLEYLRFVSHNVLGGAYNG